MQENKTSTLIYLVFFLCVYSIKSSATSIQHIKNRKMLIVSMLHKDNPPFIMTDNRGNHRGIDVDIAKKMAEALNVALKIDREAKTYNDIIHAVQHNKADIGLSKVSITLERAQYINFSTPYLSLQKTVVLNRKVFESVKKKGDESLEEFFSRGHKIGVVKGSAYEQFAQTLFPKATIIPYSEWPTVIAELDFGKIQGAFYDEFEIQKLIQRTYQGALKYIAITIEDSEDLIGMVVKKEDQHLLNWINFFLKIEKYIFNIKNLMESLDSYFINKRVK